MCKEAGRPWPTLDSDDVIDYLIMEAVAVKAAREEVEARKQAKRDEWKQDKKSLHEAVGQ